MVDISWYIYGSGILWRCVFSISVYFFLHVLFYEFLTDCCFFNQQSHISCGPAPWPGQSSRSTVAGWKKNMHLIHKLSIMVNEFPLYYFIYIYVTCVYCIYIYIIISYDHMCVYYIYMYNIYIYVYTYIHTYPKMVFSPSSHVWFQDGITEFADHSDTRCVSSSPCSIA